MPVTAGLAHANQTASPLSVKRNALVALLVKVLRPLVLLMLKQGMTAYEFAEVSRWVFAHAAMDREQFAVRGRDVWSMTKSRAAVLTGLTRREVDRLVAMNAPAVDEAREAFHRGARILAAWAHEEAFLDRDGRPRDLPIKGADVSLEWLVKHYCRDIPLRAMLDELDERGCIERLEGDRVRYVHGDISGPDLSAEMLYTVGHQAEHFMSLLEGGAHGGSPAPHFQEISVGPVAAEHRDALQARISGAIESFAAEMKRDLSTHPKSLMTNAEKRVVVGFYNGFL